MAPLNLTIDVQNYRLITPSALSAFLLQRPSTAGAWDPSKTLVREVGGPNRNAVSFRDVQDLVAVVDGPFTAHVHGVLQYSSLEEGCQEGDPVWLLDFSRTWPRNREHQDNIKVVNLRTWKEAIVPLVRVLWVPMYRKRGHDGTGWQEELITLAGPPKKRQSDGRVYNLAIIQHVCRNGLKVEVKEIMEQDTFFAQDCQRLRNIPGGDAITEEICRRLLIIQEHMSAIAATAVASVGTTTYGTHTPCAWDWAGYQSAASALVTPPQSLNGSSLAEDEDDEKDEDEEAEFQRGVQDLEDQVDARLSCGPQPVRSPHQKCNYPGPCPTPATLFNRPEYTSELRSHYHVPNHRCAQGKSHELHCVFRSANQRRQDDCLLGSRVRHRCCCPSRGRGQSSSSSNNNNKSASTTWRRPAPLVEVVPENATIEKGGRGEIIQLRLAEAGKGGEAVEEFVELPCEIEPMASDAVWALEVVGGEETLAVGQRTDSVGREDPFGQESLVVTLPPPPPPVCMAPTWNPVATGLGAPRSEQTVLGIGGSGDDGIDVFADRHLDDLDEYEDGDGADAFAVGHLGMQESWKGADDFGEGFVTEMMHRGQVGPPFWDGGEWQHSALNMNMEGFDFVNSAQDWLAEIGYPSGVSSFQN